MSKDAPTIAANQTGVSLFREIVRRKTCVYTLLSGVTLGMLVGILDIVSIFNHWKLQYDFFDIADIPFRSVIYSEVFYSSIPISWTDADALDVAVLMFSYWMAVGLFFATLICLARDIVRDRICRYALFFGTSGGVFIASLKLLAISNGWMGLAHFIGGFEQPVICLDNALGERFTIPNFVAGYPETKLFIFSYLLRVFYWTVIGLSIASFYCVIRIGKKRKAAEKIQAYCFVRGVIRRIRRDPACRAALILGAGGGMLIGGVNLLVAFSGKGALASCFEFLDRPGIALAEDLVKSVMQPQSVWGESICEFVAAIAYWATIGLLVATVFSFVRVLRMRNDAIEVTVSEE